MYIKCNEHLPNEHLPNEHLPLESNRKKIVLTTLGIVIPVVLVIASYFHIRNNYLNSENNKIKNFRFNLRSIFDVKPSNKPSNKPSIPLNSIKQSNTPLFLNLDQQKLLYDIFGKFKPTNISPFQEIENKISKSHDEEIVLKFVDELKRKSGNDAVFFRNCIDEVKKFNHPCFNAFKKSLDLPNKKELEEKATQLGLAMLENNDKELENDYVKKSNINQDLINQIKTDIRKLILDQDLCDDLEKLIKENQFLAMIICQYWQMETPQQ